jgi:hypothetical protein
MARESKKILPKNSFPPHLLVSQNYQDFQNREFSESQEKHLESSLKKVVIKQTILKKKKILLVK